MKRYVTVFFLLLNVGIFANQQALSQLVYELRDPQTHAADFRRALEKIGEYLALEALEHLDTQEMTICTLTNADATHQLTCEIPVLIPILRGGLPLNIGAHKVFPHAEVGFFAMTRDEETLEATVDYIALPHLENRTVIITDTMLATGGSLLNAVKLVEKHHPKRIFIITAIAAKPGVHRILEHNPQIQIFAAAIDPSLNDHGYIIPGLGDAGDRCYGEKIYSSKNTISPGLIGYSR